MADCKHEVLFHGICVKCMKEVDNDEHEEIHVHRGGGPLSVKKSHSSTCMNSVSLAIPFPSMLPTLLFLCRGCDNSINHVICGEAKAVADPRFRLDTDSCNT